MVGSELTQTTLKVTFLALFYLFFALFLCKETGQYRKGELGSKPLNSKVLCYYLGLQKSPVCPISSKIKSSKSQKFYIDIPQSLISVRQQPMTNIGLFV